MVSRREFLRGGAIAGLLSTAPVTAVRGAGAAAPDRPFEAVCDTRWAEGDCYLAALGRAPFRVHGVTTDPGGVLPVLSAAIEARRAVVGFTTDAVLMLAEQLAGRAGYALAFHGVHTHTDARTLTHALEGPARWVDALAQSLPGSGARWPALLAHGTPALAAGSAARGRRSVVTQAALPAGSPGQLVSWALVPAQA